MINTQKRLDLPTVFSRDYVSAKGDSSRTECLARVASRTLKSMPLTLETDLSEETERNCTTLVVTFSHNDCTEAGSHPKEKSSFRLLRHRQRQKHESTSMHWDILECRTSDSNLTSIDATLLCSPKHENWASHQLQCRQTLPEYGKRREEWRNRTDDPIEGKGSDRTSTPCSDSSRTQWANTVADCCKRCANCSASHWLASQRQGSSPTTGNRAPRCSW